MYDDVTLTRVDRLTKVPAANPHISTSSQQHGLLCVSHAHVHAAECVNGCLHTQTHTLTMTDVAKLDKKKYVLSSKNVCEFHEHYLTQILVS